MLRYLLLIAAFAGLVWVFSLGLQRDPSELPSPFIGEPAPALDLPSLTHPEERLSREALTRGMSLVNVWATWCVGCRQEHDFLMQLADRGELPIYGINWRDNRSDALRWLAQYGDPYVMTGFDEDGRTGIDWGVYGAPETFLVNAEGRVLHKHTGPLDPLVWERDFGPHLGRAGSSAATQ